MLSRLAFLVLLAGCASAPLPGGVRVEHGSLTLAGSDYRSVRYRPVAPPAALVLLEHGFTRDCGNLRGTAAALAEAGFEVLCIDAPMTGGNPALADALAAAWTGPQPVIAAGHSAGGAFAVHFAAALAQRADVRLAGVLLFDPVAADGRFAADLQRLRGVPVHALPAPPGRCNANGNALPALAAVDGAVVAPVAEGGTHIDVEGEDSGALARAACGTPRPENTQALRAQAARAAQAMLSAAPAAALPPADPAAGPRR